MASLPMDERSDLIRRMYDAANRGDLEEAMAQLHPEIEVSLAMDPTEPIEGSRDELRGHSGLRAFWQLLWGSWDAVRIEVKDVVEGVDGRALSYETWTVRGPQGIEVGTEVVDVYGFRDGLISSCDGFRDKKEALEAFGLPR